MAENNEAAEAEKTTTAAPAAETTTAAPAAETPEAKKAEKEAAKAAKKAEKEAAKEPKAEKPVKPSDRYWCGAKASREGTVYHRLQTIAAAHPGMDRTAFVEAAKKDGFAAKNSRKAEENLEQFVGGYLTAGARKGFFVIDEKSAIEAPNVQKAEPKAEKVEKTAVTEVGKLVLDKMKEKIGSEMAAGTGIPLAELYEATGKNKAQLSRTIDKLSKDGMVETDTVKEGDKDIEYIYLQQKAVDFLTLVPEGTKPDPETGDAPAAA